MKFLELIARDNEELADILAREHGKTIADAKGDIQRGVEVVECCSAPLHLLKGEFTDAATAQTGRRRRRSPPQQAARARSRPAMPGRNNRRPMAKARAQSAGSNLAVLSPPGQCPGPAGRPVQWLFYAALALLAGFLIWKNRAGLWAALSRFIQRLSDFWHGLFGRRGRRRPHGGGG